jgi:hypothetical protein
VGCLLLAVGLVLLPIGGIGLAVGGAATIAASVSIGGALGIGGGGYIMVLALGKGRHIVREYNEMPQLAITEASSWSIKKSKNIQGTKSLPGSQGLQQNQNHCFKQKVDIPKLGICYFSLFSFSFSFLPGTMNNYHSRQRTSNSIILQSY